MSNIKEVLSHKKSFIAFLTAGYPDGESTVDFVLTLEKAGADLVEIGIPFSDPTAEGPVIQEASMKALSGGMTTDGVFEIVEKIRETSNIPLAFMTYMNLVFHYGYDRFFERCGQLEVGGIILPDLPFEEKAEVEEIAEKYGVDVISLIAPTSEGRIQKIARDAKGFLYIVSSMGVTGMRNEIVTDIKTMVESIRQVTDIPCAVGFGISTPEQAAEMAASADGVIVGSAIVKIIAEHGRDAKEPIYEYVKVMKDSIFSL